MSPTQPMPAATARTGDLTLTGEDRRRAATRIYLAVETIAPDAPTKAVAVLVDAVIDAVLDQLAARERRRPTVTPTFSNPAGPSSGHAAPFRVPCTARGGPNAPGPIPE